MGRFTLLKSGAILLLALAAGSAEAQRQDRQVPVAPGSAWINQFQDTGSFGNRSYELESRMTESTWEGGKSLLIKSPSTGLVIQPDGDWVAVLDKDDKVLLRFDPPLSYDWPLEIGKSRTRTVRIKMPGQDSPVPVEMTQTVEAYEDVTVPAGTFKAYRVRTVDNTGLVTVDWWSPELRLFAKRTQERTAQHAQGPGTREQLLKSHDLRP